MIANGGGFNRWTQHFNLYEEMECLNEVSSQDLQFSWAARGDLGPLAGWGIHEVDRAGV
jgi:hypothetical protein